MKKLLLILLISGLWSQPIHHRFKDYMIEQGYVDQFSIYHAGIGGIKGVISEVGWSIATRHGYNEPSASWKLGTDFILALAWEIGEFGVEGDWSWSKYQEMYNGKALQNNGFDIFLDVAVFSIPLWTGIYWDIKRIGKNGFAVNVQYNF